MNLRLLLAVLPLLLAACGDGSATTTPATPPPSPAAASAAVAPSTTPEPSLPARSPGASASSARPVDEDEGLLAVLPEAVDGTPIQLEHQGFVDAADDPAFGGSIGTAVFFVAPGASDIVSGLVAKPLDGVYSETWYQDWRETYDQGACDQAGGVGGHAEAQLGGRAVTITTCAGGMRVYHTWVESQGVVVSLISLGDGRWGEKVMDTLRP